MADQPKGYVDAAYLDLHKVLLDRAKRASYELLHLAPGHHVLDVGCGPATDTISLGRLVGPGGEVVGVDYDVEMVDEANRRAAAAGVGTWVKHRQADAAGLACRDGPRHTARGLDRDHGPRLGDALARHARDRARAAAHTLPRRSLREQRLLGTAAAPAVQAPGARGREGARGPPAAHQLCPRARGSRPRSPRAPGAGRGGVHPGRARAPAHELRGGGSRRVLLRERQRGHGRRTEVRAGLTRRG
ncbi:MAG: methyltransferase domain-containing protein [Deltaproteobacteria bacterium]|nr:MAG: methyltransferase domain-containing protein [Deltaproteobacteria bacterium]